MNTCNICGFKGQFQPYGTVLRLNALCPVCKSLERKRLLYFILQDIIKEMPSPISVLHFAPSKGLYDFFKKNDKIIYDPKDLDPTKFINMDVDKFNICTDTKTIPSNHFDLIISTHVLEHVPCSYIDVLKEFNRILSYNGKHIICVPMKGEFTKEDMSDISTAERITRFGGRDHYRTFGSSDFIKCLTEIFSEVTISNKYNTFTPLEVQEYNIQNTNFYICNKRKLI